MASNLTDAQKLSLFEILDVPFATGHYTTSGMGTLSAQTSISSASQAQAKTEILSYLDGLEGLEQETRLGTYITRWDALSTKQVRMTGGAVGQINGIDRDPEDERETIRQRVKLLVPFYKRHEVIAREAGSRTSINMIR